MSNQKVRLWTAAKVGALVLALAIGQVISGAAVQPAYACGGWYSTYCPPPPPPPPPPPTVKKGNNGWGNGGDTTNPGSFTGGGVSRGGYGAGSS
ncbi:MAG: hypothetical protein QOJ20_5134, partial [Mycobacterium sp.]|nr:hypothetical protein [Mycobacterium sp.]